MRNLSSLPLSRRLLLQAGAAQLATAGLAGTSMVQAQSTTPAFPTRTIELVVPWQAGGGADVVARAFGVSAASHLPQPIVVVNRPGATGLLGMKDVLGAKPDGYKLLLTTNEITFVKHLGQGKYSPDDVRPIARLNADPIAIVARTDSGYKNLNDLLAAARQPGANVRVGNAGQGSTLHMAALALCQRAGVEFNHIPFAGGAPALQALLGGHIDAVSITTAEAANYVTAGTLRPLGVMAERRLSNLPEVATLRETGIDLTVSLWRALAAPKGTPDAVMAVLRTAAAQAAREPVLLDTLKKLQFSADSYGDHTVMAAQMERDSALFKELIEQVQLKLS
ncbi:tripartite tricarboxylate transporter substrate binding protein [Pantoea sp. 18069]|uniref:tripartite tricarboxylate transporter substrate binding protein n=1 Tax=Pantoea sp. 18069 TaxID=2681415 RepID=UPI001359DAB9|nr:tripartite tricarboxylate transporter substrate binding protein [Pantoea sp. 18069]